MTVSQDTLDVVVSPAVVRSVGWLLVHSLWQGLLAAFLAMCLAKLMGRQSAAARYAMYSIILSLMVVAPVVSVFATLPAAVPASANNQPVPLAPVESTGSARPIDGDVGEPLPLVALGPDARGAAAEIAEAKPLSEPGMGPITAASLSAIETLLSPWLPTIVAIWCCGVLLSSIRPIWGGLTVRRLLRMGTSPVAAEVRQTLHKMCDNMRVRRRVEILASTLVGSPIVVGCFRSVILVPASLISSLPIAQLEALLAHELAHVRRYDYLVNLLQTLVETLFFYHPAVWWLSHRIRVERENCCDDLAVSVLKDKVEYGRALLAVEEFRGSAASSSLALSAKDGDLLSRVRRLLAVPQGGDQRMGVGMAAGAIMATGLVIAIAWWSTMAVAQSRVDDQELDTGTASLNSTSSRTNASTATPTVRASSRAGRWQLRDNVELEITQKLVHATDVMTTGVIRLQGDAGQPRHVPLTFAMDYFANRVRWKAAWEEGHSVLWYAAGLGDGPGRKLPPGTKVKIDELRRIDFGHPDCVVHQSFDGWVADQLPSADLRAALEENFEIKANGKENFRYYESARPSHQPDDSVKQLSVWVGESGACQVQNLAWAPNSDEAEQIKCDLKTLSETLALVLKKFRNQATAEVLVFAFVSSRPDLPSGDLNKAFDACRENGLWTPVLRETTAAAVKSDKPATAVESGDSPFRLPDHWIVEDLRWVKEDRELISVYLQGGINVRRWDVGAKTLLSEIKLQSDRHGRPAIQGTYKLSADGRRVIGVTDAYVGVWDAGTGQLLRQLPIPKKQWEYDTVRCLACSADGSVIAAGLETSFQRTTLVYATHGIVWNASSGEVMSTFEQDSGFNLRDIKVSADGQRFLTGSWGGKVGLWETTTGKLLKDYSHLVQEWKSPDPEIIKYNMLGGIDLSPDEKMLAVGGTFGIRLIDVASGKLVRTINEPSNIDSADVEFSADGAQIAWFGARRKRETASVFLWSVADGKLLRQLKTSASVVRISSNGKQLAAGESDFYEALSVWPLTGASELGPLPKPRTYQRSNRVEENTHDRGAKAQELVDQWKPAWGQPAHGIEYGVALTVPNHRFPIGQRILMAAFLRNTSNEPKHVALRPDMFGNVPLVTDAGGAKIPLETMPLLGHPAHYRDTLQPGECFGPLYLNVGLGPNPLPGRQHWEPYWKAPQPGEFRLVHKIPFHVADASVDRNSGLDGKGWTASELVGGEVSFQIVSAENSQINPSQHGNGLTSGEVDFEVVSVDEESTKVAPPTAPAPTKVLPDSLNVMSVGFDDQGKLWSVATRREVSVRRWDFESSEKLNEAKLETEKHANQYLMGELQLSPDRSRVMAIEDGKIALWTSTTGKRVTKLEPPEGQQAHRGLSCSPDFSRIASGLFHQGGFLSRDAQAVVWDVKTGQIVRTVTHLDAVQIHCTAVSRDNRWLATGSQEAGFCLWDLNTGELKHRFANDNAGRKHSDPNVELKGASQVLSLCFSPGGSQLAMADMLGVKVFDVESGKLLHDFERPFRFGRSGLVFSPDGSLLARVGTDKVVSLWNLRTGKIIAELPSESHGGSFSQAGKWLAVGYSDETSGIRAWRIVSE